MTVPWFVILCAMLVFEGAYLWLMRHFRVFAPMCARSSHDHLTPTTGGIIFVAAGAYFAIINHNTLSTAWWLILGGAAVLAIVSFIDDVYPLPPIPRLLLQIAVMAVAFKQFCYIDSFHIYIIIILCGVGCINSFNFIDGIAGMLALYGLVVVGSLTYMGWMYLPESFGLYNQLGGLLLFALIAFAVFNLPDRIFSGDVGAITLGFFVTCMLLTLILGLRQPSLVVFIVICLADGVMTTVQRLFAGENIWEPHKQFIYQVLTSKWGLPHLAVSGAYALLQLLINAVYLIIPADMHWTYVIVVCALLGMLYFAVRRETRRLDRLTSVRGGQKK